MITREEKIKTIRQYCKNQGGFLCSMCVVKDTCKSELRHTKRLEDWSDTGISRAYYDIKNYADVKTTEDTVNHPAHYETGKYNCIDVMIETQGADTVANFCICNAFKYLYRWKNKNGIEDIKKAQWYIGKFLELQDQLEDK